MIKLFDCKRNYQFGIDEDDEKIHLFIADGNRFQSSFDIYSPILMEITIHEDGNAYTFFEHDDESDMDNIEWFFAHVKDFRCAFKHDDNYIDFVSFAANELLAFYCWENS